MISENGLENFLELMMSNHEIQRQISQAKNVDEFIDIAYAIAQNQGYHFSLEELQNQMVGSSQKSSNSNNSSNNSSIRRFIENLRWARGKNDELWHKLKKLN